MSLLAGFAVAATALAGCPQTLAHQGSAIWGPPVGMNRIFNRLHTPAGLTILGHNVPYLVHEQSAFEVWYRLGDQFAASQAAPPADILAFKSVYGGTSCTEPTNCAYEVKGSKFGDLGLARLVAGMSTGEGFSGGAFKVLKKDLGRPQGSPPVFLQCIYHPLGR